MEKFLERDGENLENVDLPAICKTAETFLSLVQELTLVTKWGIMNAALSSDAFSPGYSCIWHSVYLDFLVPFSYLKLKKQL